MAMGKKNRQSYLSGDLFSFWRHKRLDELDQDWQIALDGIPDHSIIHTKIFMD